MKRIARENAMQLVSLGLGMELAGQPRPEQMQRLAQPTNDTALPLHPHPNPLPKGEGAVGNALRGVPESSTPANQLTRIDEEPGRRWYPVIDYSRCTNCMECIDFCLFGVYGVDKVETILVEQPDNWLQMGSPWEFPHPEFAQDVSFGGHTETYDDGGITRTESILGSPSYMSPEQAGGRSRRVGPTADVYSLGAIFYALMTGRPPFQGATALEILDRVRTAEPVPPSRLVAGVSRDAETIALKCLEKDPNRRYATAEALADDLRRLKNGEPISARIVPLPERSGLS